MTQQQVLIIGYVWPEPDSSAAGSRMLALIVLCLAQGWKVTFASPATLSEHMADLPALGVDVCPIELNSSSFDTFVQHLAPAIVVFDRFMMEEQFGWRVEKHCPDALRVLDTEDLHCLRRARHAAHKAGRTVTRNDLFSDTAQREIAAIFRSDLSLIISEYEMQLLQETFAVPGAILHYCPFMRDAPADVAALPDWHARRHFVSIGNFRHAPNWDAVLWLRESLWPRIRRRLPDSELHIYGAYPPPKATALDNPGQGFRVKGWAADATAVLGAARVCLAPLRFGAGLKGKLADAMACGTPSVTTGIGAEGMHGDLPWGGRITDDPDEFVDRAVALYEQEDRWQVARDQGLAILRQRFDRRTIESRLLERLAHCRNHLAAHRLENFMGAMLRHHYHKSTQYMSQWIEAKQRLAAD